jgi:hypothetical protein
MRTISTKGAWKLAEDIIDGRDATIVCLGEGGRDASGIAAGHGEAGAALRDIFAAGMFDDLVTMREIVEQTVFGAEDTAAYRSHDDLLLLTGRSAMPWRIRAQSIVENQRAVRLAA